GAFSPGIRYGADGADRSAENTSLSTAAAMSVGARAALCPDVSRLAIVTGTGSGIGSPRSAPTSDQAVTPAATMNTPIAARIAGVPLTSRRLMAHLREPPASPRPRAG